MKKYFLAFDLFQEYEDNSAVMSTNGNDCAESTAATAVASTNNSNNKDEYKNFLNKFDSLISESKIKLKHLENNSK